MTYELIGTPRIEDEYSDQWETAIVCDVRRSDGVTGDVWLMAGVPAHHQSSATACGHTRGFTSVRVFDGGSIDTWCPRQFYESVGEDDWDTAIPEMREAIVDACEDAALAAHRERMHELAEAAGA